MISKRRRGTAIVETEKGILLTAMSKSGVYILPGGGAKRKETRFLASIRELEEETGMRAYYAKIIFNYETDYTKNTVVLIKSNDEPKPKNEVKYLAYYKKNKTDVKISKATRNIIERYLEIKYKV